MSLGVKRSAVRVMDMEMQAPADGWPRRPSLLHTLQRLLCPFFISWLRLITKLKLGTSDYSVVTGEFSMPSILHTCQHTMTPFCDNELFPLLLDLLVELLVATWVNFPKGKDSFGLKPRSLPQIISFHCYSSLK